jgi:hypothetical protein
MKNSILIGFLFMSSFLQAQTEISPLQSIQFQGLTFQQKSYSKVNCDSANARKKLKEVEYWDTVCTEVNFLDLEIYGDDTPIIQKLNDLLHADALKYNEIVYKNGADYCREIADSQSKMGFVTLYTDISVLDTFQSLISFNIGFNEFAGGAHPNYYGVSPVVDLNDGRNIRLFDLIDKKMERNFRKLLYVKFKKTYGLDALLEPETKPEDFQIAENFQIGARGLTMNYNPYEITPYVVGAPEIEMSFEEIMPYMTVWFKSKVNKAKTNNKRVIQH